VTDDLGQFVFSKPITGTLAPGPVAGVITKKDLEHPSCRICFKPIRSGDLCPKHEDHS
jgi:hypothetical protein